MVNTHTFLRPTVRKKSCPYFYLFLFFSLPYFFSPFFFTDSPNGFFLLLSFFLLHRLTPTAIFFFFFILFLSFLLHGNTWVTLSKKKRNTWVPNSQTQKIKPINTWARSYTLTHKHKPTNLFIHTATKIPLPPITPIQRPQK